MTISKTVQDVMSTELITIDREARASEAIESLSKNSIGALLVTKPEAEIIGIVSETDIVRKIAAEGLDPDQITIDGIMNCALVTIWAEASIDEAYYAMACCRVRHLVVTDEGRKVGFLSVKDIFLPRKGSGPASQKLLSEEPVTAIMNKHLRIVPEETTILEGAKLMKAQKISALLIGAQEKIDGILTERDIISKVLDRKMDIKETRVSDAMNKPVRTVDRWTPINKLYHEMRDGHIRHLVVLKSGKPVGVVSARDLIHLTAEEAEIYRR